MSTTTRAPYRPTYAPAPGSVDLTTVSICSCGASVTLEELFSHECPDDARLRVRPTVAVATGPADSLDVPEWRGGAGGHSPSRRGPSQKQLNWLLDLYAQAGEDGPAKLAELRDGREASREIDRLQALLRARTTQTAVAVVAAAARPNRFAGACRLCGANVPASTGLLVGQPGAWAVEHAAGACKPAEAHTAATPAPVVPAGHYAIPSTGANDLAFYRVDVPTDGKWAGRTFVKLVVGGKPDANVRRDHVAGILARIAADPDAAQRYGTELGQCSSCNRHLTDELSRSLGIGPECRKARA